MAEDTSGWTEAGDERLRQPISLALLHIWSIGSFTPEDIDDAVALSSEFFGLQVSGSNCQIANANTDSGMNWLRHNIKARLIALRDCLGDCIDRVRAMKEGQLEALASGLSTTVLSTGPDGRPVIWGGLPQIDRWLSSASVSSGPGVLRGGCRPQPFLLDQDPLDAILNNRL